MPRDLLHSPTPVALDADGALWKRRKFLTGVLVGLVAAPIVARADNLMKTRNLLLQGLTFYTPPGSPYRVGQRYIIGNTAYVITTIIPTGFAGWLEAANEEQVLSRLRAAAQGVGR